MDKLMMDKGLCTAINDNISYVLHDNYVSDTIYEAFVQDVSKSFARERRFMKAWKWKATTKRRK